LETSPPFFNPKIKKSNSGRNIAFPLVAMYNSFDIGMTFDTPFALIGFIILIPFTALETVHYRARGKALKQLNLLGKEQKIRFLLSNIFFALFLASVVTAFAGPRWGTRPVVEYKRGVDAVFAFDVSRSMEVMDIAPFRLGRAALVAKDAVAALGDVRVGTALGKGKGVFALPLTWDMNALAAFFDGLLTESVTGAGTNLENLVDASCKAFQAAFPAKHLVVLFSDGEELSGSLQNAADRAKLIGISLVTVGFGTEEGGEVPQKVKLDPNSGEPIERSIGEMKKNAPIISKRKRAALQNAADRSGGIFIDGNAQDAAHALTAYIHSLAPETGANSYRIEAAPRWNVFAFAGLVFLLLSKFVEKKRRRYAPS
jgi:Ca-activated chloride channel family protein